MRCTLSVLRQNGKEEKAMKHRICLAISIGSLIALAQPAVAATVPNPTVTGPIAATVSPGDPAHDYPFFSTTVDLAKYGYVEEEFFFEGLANRYTPPTLTTSTVLDGGHTYRTRMVVRRPVSPGSFNGTVIMEWQNVTAGYDLDAVWHHIYSQILRRGYAWIGVSAQQASVHTPITGLKAWSPARYGTLDLTANGTIVGDSLGYDVLSQAAQAVKSPVGVDVMGGLQVKRVLAIGASGSATKLIEYHNSIHPLAGVIDGFALGGGNRPLRTDLDVKVFKFLTETEIARNAPAYRQPDSNHLRTWEVAGSSHFDFREAQEVAPLRQRDDVGNAPPACNLPMYSRIPARFAINALMDHLVGWVTYNTEPPAAPQIETVTVGSPVAVARDNYGNALGGIRLPQHAVPTATNTGLNTGPGMCWVYGSYQPFDVATLIALYPNHGTYVSQVVGAALDNLSKGFMVMEDAAATIEDAAHSAIGKQE